MENKRRANGLAAFFAGKGFYIALILCAVIIGVTAWAMVSRAKTAVETESEINWTDLDAYRTSEYTPENPFVSTSPEVNVFAPTEEPDSGNTGSQIGETDITPTAPETQQDAPSEPVRNPDEGGGIQFQQSFFWPLNGEIEMPYAADALLYNRTLSDWRTHEGIDIAAALGTQVMAAASGRVEQIYRDDLFGMTVVIDHSGGLKSVYSNLAETPSVAVGDSVVAGAIIGSVGTTALAETNAGTHLHFAMTLDGQSVDPLKYMP